jgi:TRAP-type C4-dicarboxylate transport system permease large subunit
MKGDAIASPFRHTARVYTAALHSLRIHRVETAYKIALVIMLFVVIFNLGQALYFMMTDKGQSNRTVWALTRRIGLSLVLILMIVVGIWAGWLHPHDVGG